MQTLVPGTLVEHEAYCTFTVATISYDPRPKIEAHLRKDGAETPQIKKTHNVSPQKTKTKQNAHVPYVTANTPHISLILALCTAVHLLFTILDKGQRKEEIDRRRGRGGERWGAHFGKIAGGITLDHRPEKVLQLRYKSVSRSTEVQRRASCAEIMANV